MTNPDTRYEITERDGRGLVSRTITGLDEGSGDVDKATTSFYYDLNGNLIKKVDPTGVTENYAYDFMDRRTLVHKGSE